MMLFDMFLHGSIFITSVRLSEIRSMTITIFGPISPHKYANIFKNQKHSKRFELTKKTKLKVMAVLDKNENRPKKTSKMLRKQIPCEVSKNEIKMLYTLYQSHK